MAFSANSPLLLQEHRSRHDPHWQHQPQRASLAAHTRLFLAPLESPVPLPFIVHTPFCFSLSFISAQLTRSSYRY